MARQTESPLRSRLLRRTMPCCVLVVALCATQFPHKNKKKAENAISRVLSPGAAGTAAPGMVIYLGCGLPRTSSGLPVAVKGNPFASESRLLLGLAPDEACHAASVAGCPVGSYPTLSPLPRKPGRFAFCCATVAAPSPEPPPVVDRHLLRRSPDFPPSPQPFKDCGDGDHAFSAKTITLSL